MRKPRPRDSREPDPGSPVGSGCLQRLSHAGVSRQGLQGKTDGCGGGSRDGGQIGVRTRFMGLSSPGSLAVLIHPRFSPPAQALPRAAPSDGVDPSGCGARRPPPQLFYGQ